LSELLQNLLYGLRLLVDWRGLVEFLIITVVIYVGLSFIQGTTAMPILRGLAIAYVVGAVLANLFAFSVIGSLLRGALNGLLLALVVIFAPELRRAGEQLGRPGQLLRRPATLTAAGRTIDTIATTARRLSELRWGALIVLERNTGLGEYAETGTRLDALLSEQMLLNIFFPHAPLHDGAVIVQGERIVAAGCLLPLTENTHLGAHLGTRHRAAIGITERTDALCVVVSEENGQISIANNGRMVRNLDEEKLRKVLQVIYQPAQQRGRLRLVRGITSWLRDVGTWIRGGEARRHA
jgi:diadenylate cyclase